MRDLSTVSVLRMSFGMTVYHHLVVIVKLIEKERVMYWSYDYSLLCLELVQRDAVVSFDFSLNSLWIQQF